ncbi:hypothetical protein COCHEDRAFT_1201120 [Bipolaris maydis C5]|uniref:Uncharacterized protein n=2 Tax=Cochliobolus heterostrophus TaxID=5016 RepID=M2URT8_COCH5|nr:hypothetical protein COCHEDRAFT_1201120 [Bipolaris maydis C5]KAH7562117.1 hypothetical protein BM1_03221 [Bipolaris maydis]KAJ5030940.1 hypothetical protein J3E73DRAFT_420963 [Bipolaris maydis]KAJ6212964.1 hypothetical protein PSV09DRAFT_1201120 [Bipolaris maydis]KAJ6274225.1 hypothetical protein PSV08DRAFT_358604 [Bipolaris maydis]
MPRNGDGSSDNGPIEGHEILHGTTGDDSLQHTKHVAPMPEGEKGDTLPGFSGGGTTAQTSTSTSSLSDSKKRSELHHASPSPTSHIQQKHSRLDSDEAGIAGATSHAEAVHAREQRVKDAVGSEDVGSGAGGHADVEMLHGEATLDGQEQKSEEGQGGACDADLLQRKKAEKFGGVNLSEDGVSGESARHESEAYGGPVGHAHGSKSKTEESFGTHTHKGGETQGNSKEHGHDIAHEADLLQRKKAEKFGGVNLGDDEADGSYMGKSKAHGSTNEGSSGDGGSVGHVDTKGHNGGHAGTETQGKNKARGHGHDVANDAEQLQRKKAEKFGGVNLSQDGADMSSGLKNSTRGSTDGGPVGHAHGTKGQNEESGAYSRGHADIETYSKGNGHASEGKKNDHGLDLANDADLLQRKKAEKFGGVNLGDD